jgi:hypothetical protein
METFCSISGDRPEGFFEQAPTRKKMYFQIRDISFPKPLYQILKSCAAEIPPVTTNAHGIYLVQLTTTWRSI